jgi:release factor glutamine methyltransferase
MQIVKDVLLKTEAFLKQCRVPSPRREAEELLGHALGLTRVQVYLEFDRPLDATETDAIRALVRRRANREPLGWILGSVGFYSFDEFAVHADVLVPRPDTERLVDAALEWIPEDAETFVADIGCGSGAVGLAIAHARPLVKLFATDLSDAALANTRDNVARLDLTGRVAALKGPLLAPIPPTRTIDVVVSNPPYIRTADLADLEPEVQKWEPRLALDGGPDGLDIYRALIPAAVARARQAVLVEIGFDQGDQVRRLFEQAGLHDVEVLQDLGGRDRVVRGRVNAPTVD